ncbi:unannotated protein [freshwater metagenome]|uniref:Unannotated protein n=1 Tax=freshwater metagenome TaxID=449393 RepID=A0A6J7CRT4_9ZZZZ|nr:hypothetical protein [Actinomycetota bacterium]MUH57780.1 hypothetical protein [Actinomycetota bacterium]
MARTEQEWFELSKRIARSVQTTVGWIFWDPGAVARFEALGLPGPLGYIASRSAPFAGAGYAALVAALGSISPMGIQFVVDFMAPQEFMKYWDARNEAIREGLEAHAPEILEVLAEYAPQLEAVVDQLPFAGRPFSASHLDIPRCADPVMRGWHAINIIREWRGDTHWGLVAEHNLSGSEASTLHNAWLRYDNEWLSRSRGISDDAIQQSLVDLEGRGLATHGVVNERGLAFRQHLEDETDRRCVLPWRQLGYEATESLADLLEPPCELLLHRVDITAGERYQPASRIRP